MKTTRKKSLTLIKVKDFQGYDVEDIKRYLGKTSQEWKRFCDWHYGQTGGLWKGKFIVYKWDWDRFTQGLSDLDMTW